MDRQKYTIMSDERIDILIHLPNGQVVKVDDTSVRLIPAQISMYGDVIIEHAKLIAHAKSLVIEGSVTGGDRTCENS